MSSSEKPDRPLYCGNYEYEMLESEIRRMFDEFGDVDRIDMKTFCFVYMMTARGADRAIRNLDGQQVGRRQRPLRVQWAKTREADRVRDTRPSTTLFVVNFDLGRTRERDIERHFEPYGAIKRVEIKKAYAFVQYESVDDAQYALKKTHLSNLDGRTITVEFVQNEDPGTKDRPSRRDDRDDDRPRRRSPSPGARRRSGSPPRRRSPSPGARRRSGSPVRRRSGSPVRRRSGSPPRRRSPSPARRRSYSRSPEKSPAAADRGRSRSRSPINASPRRRSYSR